MEKFIEVTGKTEEEALAKGLEQLGLTRDDVSMEILARPKTGFLGIGSVPAKLRLTYEGPDDEPLHAATSAEVARRQGGDSSRAPGGDQSPPEAPPALRGDKGHPKAEKPAEKPRADKPKPEKKPEDPKPAPKATADDDVAAAITAFQTGLFEKMGVEAAPSVVFDGETYQVTLEGPDLGPLIGHRGETLDAVQQLTGYAVNKGRSRRARVHVDAEGYRARREESLTRLARKTADKAVKYRRNMTLEPMNAYERHVIHAALQDYPGVSTHSTGVDPNRKVVIQYDP